MIKNLQVGTKTEIHIFKEKAWKNFTSQVEEIIGDNIILGAPLKKGRVVPIAKGTKIKVYFVESETVFYFKASVLNLLKKKIPLLVIKKEGEIEKIQRREFYRLKTLIPVKFNLIKNGVSINFTEDSFDGIVKDISGSGLLLSTEIKLKENDIISVQLKLRERDKYLVKGRVIRVNNPDHPTVKKREFGIKFEALEDEIRDKIVMFIFEEQRLLRKRGLI